MALVNILCAWAFIFASLYLVCVFIAATWGVCSGMATIKLGPNVTDIRGRLGSIVYSVWKSGVQYIRQAANVISNPHSADQAAVRSELSALSKRWYDVLTEAQRAGWNDWAQTEPGKGNQDGGIYNIIKGNGGKMSGFNAFILANQWLLSGGHARVDDAPLGLTPPTAPLDVVAAYALGVCTVTWTAPVQKKANATCRIWLMQNEQVIHRQLVKYAVAEAGTADFTGVKGANGDTLLFTENPGHYAVQMDTVDEDGTKSEPSNIALFEVA